MLLVAQNAPIFSGKGYALPFPFSGFWGPQGDLYAVISPLFWVTSCSRGHASLLGHRNLSLAQEDCMRSGNSLMQFKAILEFP
jgi:hypothetical protein